MLLCCDDCTEIILKKFFVFDVDLVNIYTYTYQQYNVFNVYFNAILLEMHLLFKCFE